MDVAYSLLASIRVHAGHQKAARIVVSPRNSVKAQLERMATVFYPCDSPSFVSHAPHMAPSFSQQP